MQLAIVDVRNRLSLEITVDQGRKKGKAFLKQQGQWEQCHQNAHMIFEQEHTASVIST